ncbi:unnamed protein product [Rotaria socialis]|uniref:Glycoside hydrolase family 31 TIM barrel domain-containing protein n=1 Tax=Rotaria socialis TaxID=392032 RepID=A0A818T6H4_9BILA|nr:unnamed protein product [Rotaria socialis]
MPLFISNRQYTVWVNESRRVNFDLNSPNEWIIQSEWNATNIQFYCPVENSFLSEYNMSRPFERFFNLYKTQNRKINPSFTALVQARGETTRISPLFVFGPWTQTGNVLNNQTEIDVVNKNAALWYQKQIQESIDLGHNEFMLDFREYTPVNSISSNEMSGLEMHNHFIGLYQKTVYEMTLNYTAVENILHLDENEKKSSSINYQSDFLFHACSGYTHRAQYSQLHWPGDASVDWNIYSGIPAHSHRWLQVGTFSGFIHDETEGSTCTQERVQMFTNNQTEYIGRQYAKLRTQIFPYIYTLVHEAHATVQDVYLPLGENWIDISTNLIYDHDTDGRYRLGKTDIFHGGQWIMNVRDDLLTIPLFARADSIIPPIDSSAFT